MTEKTGLTTSELSGLTGLSVVTIQRYVRRYRNAFSPSAAMPMKGRRFGDDDVKKILFINDMTHQKRAGEIDSMLSGEINLTLFDVRQFVQMYRNMAQMLKIIEALFEDVKIEKQYSGAWVTSLRDRINRIEDQLQKQDKRIYRSEMVRGIKHLPKNEAEEVVDMLVETLHKQHDKGAIGNALKKIFG
jgi:DNA-binding transcriptional MerR regulator